MRAIILAAGVGSRLFGDSRTQLPKSLIELEGATLLQRHIEILRGLGIRHLSLVVGYRKDEVAAEALRHAPAGFVEVIENPMYRGGSLISMWMARQAYRSGDDVLFMDADTLYDPEILRRLIAADGSAMSFDEDLDEGDDPVRICMRAGHIADFGKRIDGSFDAIGEWPGFLKVTPKTGALLAASMENLIDGGHLTAPYEDAMRDVIVGAPAGTIGIVDVSDLDWIEIDFPDDLKRARTDVAPRLKR